MVKIYGYRKDSDQYTTYTVQGEGVTELCTLDGVTYISVTENLPQHDERLTVAELVLTDDLRSQIKKASPHIQLLNDRIKAKIRERYDAEDEMYFSRISIGALMGQYAMEAGEQEKVLAYGAYIEEIRQWGRDEKAKMGLA